MLNDGMKTEPVATSAAEEQHAAWGPDGNSIIFDLSTASDATNQLYLARRARRGAPWESPRRITTDGSSDPKWSPDGRLIAYCAKGELRVIAPDGSGRPVVVSTSAGQPQPAYPFWSRDSQNDLLQSVRRAIADEHLGGVRRRRPAAAAGDVRRSDASIAEA